MNNKMPISEYRKSASFFGESMGNQCLACFLIHIVHERHTEFFDGFSPFTEESMQQNLLSFLVDNLLLFAFNYALFYIALVVVRGGRPKAIFYFQFFKKYFGSILVINLINSIINWLLNSLIFLPMFLISGVSAYTQLLFNSSTVPTDVMPGDFLDISFVLSTVGMIFVSALIMSIVGGLFQFAAWTKFDYPDLSVVQCLKYGWFLLKDRIGTYILLQLSFIGWYLLGAIALFIGLLWVIVYVNVSVAEFYEQARIEKGGPEAYFA